MSTRLFIQFAGRSTPGTRPRNLNLLRAYERGVSSAIGGMPRQDYYTSRYNTRPEYIDFTRVWFERGYDETITNATNV